MFFYSFGNGQFKFFCALYVQPLLECERCQNCYHPACLGPNYPKPNKRKKPWVSWPQWYFPQRARPTKKFQYALLSKLPWYVRKCQSKKRATSVMNRISQRQDIKVAKWQIQLSHILNFFFQVCMTCIRCKSCGVTPGKSWDTEWNHDKGLCPDCTRLFDQGEN